MGTKHSYLEDPYRKESSGTVTFVEFTDIIVDDSILFPVSYGQPNDKGAIYIDEKKFEIVDVWDDGEGIHLISHDTYPQDCKGKTIRQEVDWDIRYNHMKFRTAMRVIAGISYEKYGATHRLNQTYEDYAWIDLEFAEISEEIVREIEAESNKILASAIEPTYRVLSREQFLNDKGLMAITKSKVPDIPEIRTVKIGTLPEMMEMGTLVKNTSEAGTVVLKTNLIKGKVGTRLTVTMKKD